ncbi:MAG: hypothetical protein U1D29_13045 [Burkholderiales bacterium]|nr:hypothetical protein [Burkholderiales bacterium]
MPGFDMPRFPRIQGARTAIIMLLAALVGGAAPASAATISTQWRYEVSVLPGAPTPDAVSKLLVGAAGFLGPVGIGTGRDTGTIDKNSYTLQSRIEGARLLTAVFSNLNVTRQSTGRFVNGIALTLRYTDKRGDNAELMSVTNLTARRYEFSKGGSLVGSEPLKVAASDLAMAPYAFIGKPAPSQSAFLALSDGKTVRQIILSSKTETMKVAGKVVNAVRLSGNAGTGTFDLWVRASPCGCELAWVSNTARCWIKSSRIFPRT